MNKTCAKQHITVRHALSGYQVVSVYQMAGTVFIGVGGPNVTLNATKTELC